MDLIALPVLAANVCNAGPLARHRQWLNAQLSARLHDVDRVAALADILHSTSSNEMLQQAAGLFAVAAKQPANLTRGYLPAALDGADDCPEVVTGH